MSQESTDTYHGSCMCGAITYTIQGPLPEFGSCHCQTCQKASGTAHGTNIGIARTQLTLSDPQGLLKGYESSPGKVRSFCGHCGTPIHAALQANPDFVRMRIGSLDTPVSQSVKAHSFVEEKAAWYEIGGRAPQFSTWADPDVLVQLGSKQPK